MKTLLVAASFAFLLAGSAFAGRIGVWVNPGGFGCSPRYYAPPVCYTPRVISYCPPPVTYFRSAPVMYYSSPAVVVAPVRRTVYRAPVVTGGVTVAPVSFGWRR